MTAPRPARPASGGATGGGGGGGVAVGSGGLAEQAALWAVAVAAALTVVVAGGAAAACLLAGTSPAGLGVGAAAEAAVRLPTRLGDPATAWPDPLRAALPGPGLYWAAQAAVLAVAAALGWAGWRAWRWLSDGPAGALGVRADAGFARRGDLRTLRVSQPEPGRITLGTTRGRLVACEPQTSLAVVGPTGCGKTAGFAIPALLEWKGPVIATSVKADLIAATAEHRRRRGGTVWVYDPTGSTDQPPARWSPLSDCGTWQGAQRVAAWMAEAAQARFDSVTDGDYWYTQARKGLAPYLFAAARSQAGLATLSRWIDTQESVDVERILRRAIEDDARATGSQPLAVRDWMVLWQQEFVEAGRRSLRASPEERHLADQDPSTWPPGTVLPLIREAEKHWQQGITGAGCDPAADPRAPLNAARALWGKEARLRGSVFATIENVLTAWADPGVIASAPAGEGTDAAIDFDAWLAGDNTIYVVAPSHEQARLRPVLAVLVQQAVRAALDTAARRKDGALAHPCLVLLDEAGNIAPLRDLPAYAATVRSHDITLVTIWQDLAQIRALYRDRAETVVNNHRAKLFGTGIADQHTLEYLSRLVGDEHRTERNVSTDLTGGRRSISEHHTYRRAAPVDVLRRIRPGEAVLLYGSELPAHVRLRPWFRDPILSATSSGVPPTHRARARAALRR